MNALLSNYRERKSRSVLGPVLAAGLLPLALMGVTAVPAIDYGSLSSDLRMAEGRYNRSEELRRLIGRLGSEGPPTERFEELLSALVGLLPANFEPTAFYQASLTAARGLDLELESIVPMASKDLALRVGDFTVYERSITLTGTGNPAHFRDLLQSLHRQGHPVSVHSCRLDSQRERPGVFRFQLELGAFYLSTPPSTDEPDVGL